MLRLSAVTVQPESVFDFSSNSIIFRIKPTLRYNCSRLLAATTVHGLVEVARHLSGIMLLLILCNRVTANANTIFLYLLTE